MEPERDELPPEGARYKNRDWNPGSIPPDSTQEESRASHDAEEAPPAGILVPITARDFREHWPELARYARLPVDRLREFQEWSAIARNTKDLVEDLAQLKAYVDSNAGESSLPPPIRLWGLYSVSDQLSETLPTDQQALLAELKSHVRSILTPEQWAGVEARDATIFEHPQVSRLPFLLHRLPRLLLLAHDRSALLDGILALLDHKQRYVFAEATEAIQLNLVQIAKALELPAAAAIFSVDLLDWFSLKSRGLVNEEYLTREQLTELKDFKPFNVALGRRPLPNPGPTVPIQLVEFQTNWDHLSSLARITKNDLSLVEYIERSTKRSTRRSMEDPDVIEPFLNEDQKDQLTATGYTYISLDQIERLYSIGQYIRVSPTVWLEHRDTGVVFDGLLTEEVVSKLRSYPHFRDIYDTKYNTPLIAQRKAEQRQERREHRRTIYRKLFLFALTVGAIALAAYEYDRRSKVISSNETIPQATQASPSTAPQVIIQTPKVEQKPQSQIFIQSREQTTASPLSTDTQESEANQPKNALYWRGISSVSVSAFDGIGLVMEAASRGDGYDALAAEVQRVKSLKYPLDGVFPLGSRSTARKLNEEALTVFRDNPGYALSLQTRALATYANDTEIAGNLAHYLLLDDRNEQALLTAIYALAIPPGKLTTGSPANWQVLASAFARLDRMKNAEDALLVGLAITANLDGFCKSLLRHGTEFGPKVQSVVTTIFKKIQDRGPLGRGSPDVVPSCSYPPTF